MPSLPNRGVILGVSGVTLGLFFLSPYLTIAFLIILAWSTRIEELGHLAVCFLILFLAILNSTKTPVSDLLQYKEWYQAARGLGFFEFFSVVGSDPLYVLYVYIHQILFDSFPLFIFTTSVFSYLIYYWAILRLERMIHSNGGFAIVAFFMFALLNESFSISGHLIRQFLAGSLFFMTFTVSRPQKRLLVYLIACLIHFSLIVFLPVVLRKWDSLQEEKWMGAIGLLSLGLLLFSGLVFPVLGSLNSGLRLVDAFLGRLQGKRLQNDGDLGLAPWSVLILSVAALWVVRPIGLLGPWRIAFFYACGVVIGLAAYPLFLLRYFMYVYFFLPLHFYFFQSSENKVNRVLTFFLLVFLLCRFSTALQSSVWVYFVNDNLFLVSLVLGK